MIKYLLITMVLLGNLLGASANSLAAQAPIKVAVDEAFAPYSFRADDGQLHGLLIDLWQLWSEKTGQPIEFVASSWPKTLENLRSGTVDIHSGLAVNPQRKRHMAFSQATFPFTFRGFVLSNSGHTNSRVEDFAGQRVGLLSNSYLINILPSSHRDIQLVEYDSFDAMLSGLLAGEISAFFDDSLSTNMELVRRGLWGRVQQLADDRFNQSAAAAVRPDREKLLGQINRGLNAISTAERQALTAKWSVAVSSSIDSTTPLEYILSRQEINWLKQQPKITIAAHLSWRNFSETGENNQPQGYHVDLVENMNKVLGDYFQIEFFNSWSEAYQATLSREVDAVIGLSWSEQRERELFDYSTSYYTESFKLITREEDAHRITGFKDLDNRFVWSLKNAIYKSLINRESPSAKVMENLSKQSILLEISRGNGDATLLSSPDPTALEGLGLTVSADLFPKEGSLSLGVPKGNPTLVSIFNKVLAYIPPDQHRQMESRWFNNSLEQQWLSEQEQSYLKESTIVVGIEENWPPFDFVDENGQWSGITKDYFSLLAAKTGMRFTTKAAQWHDLLEMYHRGEIDVLPILLATEERRKKMLFTQPYTDYESFLYVRNNRTDIKSFADLRGKTIARLKGAAFNSTITRYYPEITILETTSTKDSMVAVLSGDADALMTNQATKSYLERRYTLTGLKAVKQRLVPDQTFSMAVSKDNQRLRSILNKGMSRIPESERLNLYSQWLSVDKQEKKALSAIVMQYAPPFDFSHNPKLGISYDLTQAVVSSAGLSIGQVKKQPLSLSNRSVFAQNPELDMLVGVQPDEGDGLYYSTPLFAGQQVVVTRAEEARFINSVEQLEQLKVAISSQASGNLSQQLAPLLQAAATGDKGSVETFSDPKSQLEALMNNSADALIIDLSAFNWLLQKQQLSAEQFRLSHIFPLQSGGRVAFRNLQLRDSFNRSLERIKAAGLYQRLYDKYQQQDSIKKIEFSRFIAGLSGEAIYHNQRDSLNEIYLALTTFTPVEAIRAYDDWGKVFAQHKLPKLAGSFTLQSDISMDGQRQRVGSIELSFADQLPPGFSFAIPDSNIFADLGPKAKRIIDRVYQQHYKSLSKLALSPAERRWIQLNPKVKYTANQWQPIIVNENGRASGLAIDYLDLIGEKTGISFEFVSADSWQQAIDLFKKGEVGLLPGLGDSQSNRSMALLSQPLTSFPFVIVTQQSSPYVEKITDLSDKTLVTPKFFTSYHLIRENYPGIKLITTDTVEQALQAVSDGRADAFVGHLAIAAYHIKVKFNHLKIAGLSGFEHQLHLGTQHNSETFISIINKAIGSISETEKRAIRERWLQTEIQTEIDYRILYQIVAAALIIIFAVLFYARKLSTAKRAIERAQDEAERQHAYFKQIFNNQASGVLIFNDLRVIKDVNQQICNMTGFDYETLINKESSFLYESRESWLEVGLKHRFIERLKKGEMVDCQARFRRTNGETFAVRIIASSLPSEGEYLSIITDITEIITAHQALTESNAKLSNTVEELTQTRSQLVQSEKMASLGSLVAGIAHEVNTPIGVSVTIASSLDERCRSIHQAMDSGQLRKSDLSEFISQVEEASGMLSSTLRNASELVKSFKQVSADQTSLQRRKFDVKQSINEILSTLSPKLKGQEVITAFDPDIEMDSYPGALGQIITNLTTNALVHAFGEGNSGIINIRTSLLEGDQVEISFSDNGQGIPEANLANVFDPFFTTRLGSGGTGLGLNITYNLVTGALGGSIAVDSVESQGTTFTLRLPLVAPNSDVREVSYG